MTDKQAWMQIYCAYLMKGFHHSEAANLADTALVHFQRRYPHVTAQDAKYPATQEPKGPRRNAV